MNDTTEREIIQESARKLLVKEKFQAAVDLLEMELDEKNYSETHREFESQFVYNLLGYGYMRLMKTKQAENLFKISKTIENSLDPVVYLGALNNDIKKNYVEAMGYYKEAFIKIISNKGQKEKMHSTHGERNIIIYYTSALLNGMREGEISDKELEILFCLRDLMIITPTEKAVYTNMGYILKNFYEETSSSVEDDYRAKDILRICDYMSNRYSEFNISMYRELFYKVTDLLFHEDDYNLYYTVIKKSKGTNNSKNIKPTLKEILREVEALLTSDKVEKDYFIFNKYRNSISVIKVCLKNRDEGCFELYYTENIECIENVIYDEGYFINNNNLSRYYESDSIGWVKRVITDYFKYNEISHFHHWKEVKEKVKRYSVDYEDGPEKLTDLLEADKDIFGSNEIRIGCWPGIYEGIDGEQEIIDFLVENRENFKTLKRLFIGDTDIDSVFIGQMNYSKLWSALPYLEEVFIKGTAGLILGEMIHNNIKKLTIEGETLSTTILENLTDAELPQLSELCLHFECLYDNAIGELEFFMDSLYYQRELEKLSFCIRGMQSALVEGVLNSDLVMQVNDFDFSGGSLSEKGIRSIVNKIGDLPNLKSLRIKYHSISEEIHRELINKCDQLKVQLVLDVGEEPDDEEEWTWGDYLSE